MKMTFLGGCDEFKERIGSTRECCYSCHTEWEDEVGEPLETEFDDGYYKHCCGLKEVY